MLLFFAYVKISKMMKQLQDSDVSSRPVEVQNGQNSQKQIYKKAFIMRHLIKCAIVALT